MASEHGLANARESALMLLGRNARAQGRHEAAIPHHLEALLSGLGRSAEAVAVAAVVNLTEVLADGRERERALQLLAFARAQPALHGPSAIVDRIEGVAETALAAPRVPAAPAITPPSRPPHGAFPTLRPSPNAGRDEGGGT